MNDRSAWFRIVCDASSIVTICFSLYLLMQNITNTNSIGLYIFIMFGTTNFYIFPTIAAAMVNEALDDICWCFQTHTINMKLFEKDIDLKDYLHFKHFVDASEKVRLTSGNAYVINRGAILTVFSAILTYFFIILQFAVASISVSPCGCENTTRSGVET